MHHIKTEIAPDEETEGFTVLKVKREESRGRVNAPLALKGTASMYCIKHIRERSNEPVPEISDHSNTSQIKPVHQENTRNHKRFNVHNAAAKVPLVTKRNGQYSGAPRNYGISKPQLPQPKYTSYTNGVLKRHNIVPRVSLQVHEQLIRRKDLRAYCNVELKSLKVYDDRLVTDHELSMMRYLNVDIVLWKIDYDSDHREFVTGIDPISEQKIINEMVKPIRHCDLRNYLVVIKLTRFRHYQILSMLCELNDNTFDAIVNKFTINVFEQSALITKMTPTKCIKVLICNYTTACDYKHVKICGV